MKLVPLTPDDIVFLEDGDPVVDHGIPLFLCYDVDVLDDDYFHSHCRCQSPDY